MKLEDIKATIDSYFDSISEEDFFDLLTNEYHMTIVYDIDLSPLKSDIGYGNALVELDNITYEPIQTKDMFINEIVKVVPPNNTYEFVSNDDSCISYSLSFAA